MRSQLLRFDDANMGRVTVSAQRLARAKQTLLQDWSSGRQGWLSCPDDHLKQSIWRSIDRKKFDTCLVIGIGGSELGARAAWHALKDQRAGMRLEFAGSNTDPDELEGILRRLDWKRTLVNIISKSGDTLEPMAAFFVVRDIVRKKIGKKFAQHIVATTENNDGLLRYLAMREGYTTLDVPTNVGGRFSVLTPVGLFPLFCAGADLKALLNGAGQIRDAFFHEPATVNEACRFAGFLVAHHKKQGRHIHVFMPYSERLKLCAAWMCQLWAESLGKTNTSGPTPIAALGATDQHSQIQLYMEGPDDKVITFIEVMKFASHLRVPETILNMPRLGFLAQTSFEKIIHAERSGTAAALSKLHRPNGTLVLQRVDEKTLGALFFFFQIATGIAGELYEINTYNQPGVEEGKRAMVAILKR